MDDYTWQQRLQARKAREHRRLSLVIFLLAAMIGSALWYFFFYIRTPEYSLAQLQTAIAEHDGETFARYVNQKLLNQKYMDQKGKMLLLECLLNN